MGQKFLKNINYSIYIYWHLFFGHISAIFGQSGWHFLWLLLYYKSINFEKSWFWALIAVFNFLGPIGAWKRRGPTDTHMGMGPRNATKKFTHLVDHLSHLLSRNYVSNFVDLEPPLSKGAINQDSISRPRSFQPKLKAIKIIIWMDLSNKGQNWILYYYGVYYCYNKTKEHYLQTHLEIHVK